MELTELLLNKDRFWPIYVKLAFSLSAQCSIIISFILVLLDGLTDCLSSLQHFPRSHFTCQITQDTHTNCILLRGIMGNLCRGQIIMRNIQYFSDILNVKNCVVFKFKLNSEEKVIVLLVMWWSVMQHKDKPAQCLAILFHSELNLAEYLDTVHAIH